MKRILVATDGSESAKEAVRTGLELATEQGAHVTFLHVYPPAVAAPVAPGLDDFAYEPVVFDVPPPDQDSAILDALSAASKGGVEADGRTISGDAVWEICAAADDIEADLIVVGSRGLGAISSALLGSVSHGVVKHTKHKVLVVHAPTHS